MFYKQLGEQLVFKIWWMYHLFFMLNVYVIANVYIYIDSSSKFTEFSILNQTVIKIYNKVVPKFLSIAAHQDQSDKKKSDFDDIMFQKVFHDTDGTLRVDQLRKGFNSKLMNSKKWTLSFCYLIQFDFFKI